MVSSYTQYNFVRVTSFLGYWFLLNLIVKKKKTCGHVINILEISDLTKLTLSNKYKCLWGGGQGLKFKFLERKLTHINT